MLHTVHVQSELTSISGTLSQAHSHSFYVQICGCWFIGLDVFVLLSGYTAVLKAFCPVVVNLNCERCAVIIPALACSSSEH